MHDFNPRPRRLADRLEHRGMGTGPIDWLGRGLAIGGGMGVAYNLVRLLTRHQSVLQGATMSAFFAAAMASGVLLSALAAADFKLAEMPAKVSSVLVNDLLVLGVVLLFWVIDSVASGGGGDNGQKSSAATPLAAPRVNFAAELLDPVTTARVLGVASVRIEGVGLNTAHFSRAYAAPVDDRGKPQEPRLNLVVLQGPGVEARWDRAVRKGRQLSESMVRDKRGITVRASDTMLDLSLLGYKGDVEAALVQLGTQSVGRLFAQPGPLPG